MAYERVNWQDYPSKATPLNAENLNVMDEGIANLDAESESLKAFGNEGKLVYVHDGALDTLEPSNLDLHVGSPTVVTEAAQMTDSSKIYVYNGEETGYTAGDWYSYDGEQWVDRGPFNEPEIVTDKELTVSDRPADGKVVGDRLATKAEIDGAYDGMTVGSAEQLISTVFVEDNAPYTFRTAGGYADIGDRMQDSIIGGSIVWNQLMQNGNFADTSNWYGLHGTLSTANNVMSVSVSEENSGIYQLLPTKNGHKYLLCSSIKIISNSSTIHMRYVLSDGGAGDTALFDHASGTWSNVSKILSSTSDWSRVYLLTASSQSGISEGDTINISNFVVIDLTQMFGSEIADFIYYIEQANPGAGVAIFRKMFPKSYYEYNPGEIKSLTGLAAHETTGFNQWDEEWELGTINLSNGAKETSSTRIRSKNYIPVLSGSTYAIMVGNGSYPTSMRACFYDSNFNFVSSIADFPSASTSGLHPQTFTIPSNADYMLFSPYSDYGTTYNHDICINLSWDGERDGEYEPYIKHTYPLDSSITLRGMLHRDVDGNFHYHGDKYESDGTVTRKYGIVDLGTLNWIYESGETRYRATLDGLQISSHNLICPVYQYSQNPIGTHDRDKYICGYLYAGTPTLFVTNFSYTDAATFKAAMDGVMLVYELAEPTTEQAAPFAANQVVDDFGTEAYTFTEGAFEMPVGHESKYTNNLRAKLEMAPNSPSGDGKYLVKQEDGLNEYVPYVEHDPTKANIDGNYEEMTVGNAEQLVSTVTVNDQVPYTFRTAGGSADIGDRLTESIIGGTVAWNQLCGNDSVSISQNGISIAFDKTTYKTTVVVSENPTGFAQLSINAALSVHQGHKVLMMADKVLPNGFEFYSTRCQGGVRGSYPSPRNIATIIEANNEQNNNIMLFVGQSTTPGTYEHRLGYIDLTAMFGTTIADYIYSLEQANPGDGVAWFKKLFPKDYYPYDAGSLKSVEGLQSHETVGFNLWDEETADGFWNDDGTVTNNTNYIRCKNKIPVLPNTTYYFKAPSSAGSVYTKIFGADEVSGKGIFISKNTTFTIPEGYHYFAFTFNKSEYGTTYNHDICINLSWDGERDGEYEPYIKRSYPLDSSLTLRGIPKLDINDASLYFDGDRYNPDGSVERRYGIVDLGTLTWDRTSAGYFYSTSIKTIIKNGSTAGRYDHVRCRLYVAANYPSLNSLPDKSMCVGLSGTLQIHDGGYETGAELKAALDGVMLLYELAEPTIEEAEPFQSPQVVDDFGTEAYTFTEGSFAMPVGHDSKYQLNLRAKLEMAPNSPDEDGAYLLSHYNGQNSYIPYVAPRGLPMNPSEDGEYELILTMSNGTPTLEWTRIYNPNQS